MPPSKKCVLIVDDEAPVRETIEEILQEVGYDCLVAADGFQGVSLFEQYRDTIDVALVDLSMEGMTGSEVIQRLKEIRPGFPAVLTSGYLRDEEIDHLLLNGVDAFLPKPFQIQVLLSTLERVMGAVD